MKRFLSAALSLTALGLLTVAPAQTQIGNVTLTPVRPTTPAKPAPASATVDSATVDHSREAVPAGWHEIRGRVSGPGSAELRLPAGSEVRVTLVDATASRSLLDVSFATPRLSAPYQMVYNPVRLNASRVYVVRAEIVDGGGKVLYRSADVALPGGQTATVNLTVRAR